MARLALEYSAAFGVRCPGLGPNGTIPVLRSRAADQASLVAMLTTAGSIYTGLVGHVHGSVARAAAGAAGADRAAALQILRDWQAAGLPPAPSLRNT